MEPAKAARRVKREREVAKMDYGKVMFTAVGIFTALFAIAILVYPKKEEPSPPTIFFFVAITASIMLGFALVMK